jgi:dUTP pyrophosphatase
MGAMPSSVAPPPAATTEDAVGVLVSGQADLFVAHPGDAGHDLRSAEDLVLAPGGRALVGTGTALALPEGTVGLVCPRSGLASRHGVTVLNAPGVVDAGYRGEIRVALLNTDPAEPFPVRAGDRIAQLVVVRIPRVEWTAVESLPGSARGDAGFGSSGVGDPAAPAPDRIEE